MSGQQPVPKFQIASDVVRDGLGLELIDESEYVVAEVFRCDADKTLTLNTFSFSVDADDLALLLEKARVELDPFEDGTPLSEATFAPPVRYPDR